MRSLSLRDQHNNGLLGTCCFYQPLCVGEFQLDSRCTHGSVLLKASNLFLFALIRLILFQSLNLYDIPFECCLNQDIKIILLILHLIFFMVRFWLTNLRKLTKLKF